MRIAVVGGGPGGLYFAALAKQLDPGRTITVWERNPPGDTYGFGVVFSDETLGGIEHADPIIHDAMAASFARWDDIDVRLPRRGDHQRRARLRRDEPAQAPGHPSQPLRRTWACSCGSPRPRRDLERLRADHDLVVAADGVNSGIRTELADVFRPTFEGRRCRYIWFGTGKVFDAFTFDVRETDAGVMQVHAYPYDETGSTLIVEMTDEVWQKAGFAESPAMVDPASLARERLRRRSR